MLGNNCPYNSCRLAASKVPPGGTSVPGKNPGFPHLPRNPYFLGLTHDPITPFMVAGGMPGKPKRIRGCYKKSAFFCNTLGAPIPGPRACQVTTARCTPTPHPSPSIHTGWVVASGDRTPNLTFNTSGSPADATSMNGRRRVRGWGASGCSNLTCSGIRDWCAKGVTIHTPIHTKFIKTSQFNIFPFSSRNY